MKKLNHFKAWSLTFDLYMNLKITSITLLFLGIAFLAYQFNESLINTQIISINLGMNKTLNFINNKLNQKINALINKHVFSNSKIQIKKNDIKYIKFNIYNAELLNQLKNGFINFNSFINGQYFIEIDLIPINNYPENSTIINSNKMSEILVQINLFDSISLNKISEFSENIGI